MSSSSWILNEEQLLECQNESGVLISVPADVVPLSSKIGEKRIASELSRLSSLSGALERGFRVSSLAPTVWRVDFFNFSSLLAGDLERRSLHLVTALLVFEGAFPVACGPSVRLVSPRFDFVRSSGELLLAGGLLLPSEPWKAAQSTESVLAAARTVLASLRLDEEATQPCFTHEEWAAALYRRALLATPFQAQQELVLLESGKPLLGNKVLLPSSFLSQLTRNGEDALPSPLVIEIRTKHSCSYAGVWEFSASVGCCEVPSWMLKNLGAKSGSKCALRLASLPQCSFLRLQPFSRKFLKVHGNDRDKVLASLQVSMQRFAALTVGDVISLVHDDEIFWFFVLDARPAKAVNCVATNGFLEMELDFAQPVDFTESAEALGSSMDHSVAVAAVASGAAGEGVLCKHCRRIVPMASFGLHEAGCARRNVFCEKCDTPVEKAAFEEHMLAQHAMVPCKLCAQAVEAFLMQRHMKNDCKERKVSCDLCGFYCSFKNMSDHQEMCSNQSVRCGECGRKLLNKNLATHECRSVRNELYCPLCVSSQEALAGEREFVDHLEKKHSAEAKQVHIACPICIQEGSISMIGPHPVLLAHLELHKYRLSMRKKI